jgi:hypothetical protein
MASYLFTPQTADNNHVMISEMLGKRKRRTIGRAVRRAKGWQFQPRPGSVLTAMDLSRVSRFMRELA